MKKLIIILTGVCLTLFGTNVFALAFNRPHSDNDLVGTPKLIRVGTSSYVDLAQKYDVGFYELVEANPGVDINKLRSTDRLLIPNSYLLPKAARQGIVINLAEMRLYYYPKNTNEVYTFPVGIGRQGWGTPLGKTHITAKAENPEWRPTPAVRADFLKKYGYPLPEIVMPGPDNPLGHYALRLKWPSYLIHGTNNPAGVGKRISAGCVRMFNPDAGMLYSDAAKGTSVHVVYQPYKAGWKGKQLYLEAHMKIPGHDYTGYRQVIKAAEKERHGTIHIDWEKARQVAKLGLGVPQKIGHMAS